MRNRSLRILVADDDAAICDMLVNLAASLGHICDTAADGRECLKKVTLDHHDLLFLDLVLPRMDGDQVLRVLKDKMPGMDIVVISAQDDEDIIQQTIARGASAYLVKPFDIVDVKSMMQRIATQTEKGYCDLVDQP
jgi:CheY-like chemotaxis protein